MTDPQLLRDIFAAQGKSFRGSVLDFIKDAPMGKGHGNEGSPFDCSTAEYLRPVFAEYDKARANNTRLLMVVLAGVKTMKSFTGEAMAADHVCNGPGDFGIFFATADVRDSGSTTRIVEYLRSVPGFARKMLTIANRFGDAKGALKFPDKTLFILPANMPSAQQKNFGGVILQDGFLLERNGMIAEIIARTTAYRKEAIIYLESQGGEAGYDLDNKYLETDQRELYVRCPHCGQPHVFNWKVYDADMMTRPDDFAPTPPLIIPSLDHNAWIEHYRPLMMEGHQRIAGFQRGDYKLIKRDDGSYIGDVVKQNTHVRCFHCDGMWRDDGEFGPTRIALDRSSHYIAINPNAIIGNVGFNFPQWITRRNDWGTIMLDKLQAQKNASELGNFMDLKKWWQKTAARTWVDELGEKKSQAIFNSGSYETDPDKRSFGEQFHCRQMTVDCGKDAEAEVDEKIIGKLFFEVRDWDKTGNSKQLARGMVESIPGGASAWDLLAAQQRYWKIPCRRVFVDAALMPSQVMEAAAKHFELIPPDKTFQLPSTWRLLWGADGKRIGSKGQTFVAEAIPGVWRAHDKKGKLWGMGLQKIRWLNYWFEDQLVRILMQTASVKWENLTQDKLVIVDVDGNPSRELTQKYCEFERDTPNRFRSWNSGLDSRYLDKDKNKYLDTYKQGHWTEPRDLSLMQLVGVAADGLLGHVGTTNE